MRLIVGSGRAYVAAVHFPRIFRGGAARTVLSPRLENSHPLWWHAPRHARPSLLYCRQRPDRPTLLHPRVQPTTPNSVPRALRHAPTPVLARHTIPYRTAPRRAATPPRRHCHRYRPFEPAELTIPPQSPPQPPTRALPLTPERAAQRAAR